MMIVQNILASKVILTLGRVRDLYSRVEMEAGQDLIFAATNPFGQISAFFPPRTDPPRNRNRSPLEGRCKFAFDVGPRHLP